MRTIAMLAAVLAILTALVSTTEARGPMQAGASYRMHRAPNHAPRHRVHDRATHHMNVHG